MNLLNLTDSQYISLMTDLKPIDCKVHGQLITLTPETIKKARLMGISLEVGKLHEIYKGTAPFNSEYGIENATIEAYEAIEKYLSGKYDHYFTSIQRGIYIQTNKSVPMFGG